VPVGGGRKPLRFWRLAFPAMSALSAFPGELSGKQERADYPLGSLRQTYDAALISVTWIVLVALSNVPVTSTFCPANGWGFFWSSSW
jgi:hypothetical protein